MNEHEYYKQISKNQEELLKLIKSFETITDFFENVSMCVYEMKEQSKNHVAKDCLDEEYYDLNKMNRTLLGYKELLTKYKK